MKHLPFTLVALGMIFSMIPMAGYAEEDSTQITRDGLTYEIVSLEDGTKRAYITDVVDKANVTSVYIPDSIDNAAVIGIDGALDAPVNGTVFTYCPNLETIEVSPENSRYSSVDGVLYNKNGTRLLRYPRGRKGEYNIPEGTTLLDVCSFAGAAELTSVSLPESLQDVQAGAFDECFSLETVNGAVPTTNGHLFVRCSCLKAIQFAEMDEEHAEIIDLDFTGCTSLEKIVIPKTRILTGNVTIAACDSLQEITLPNIRSTSCITVIDNVALERMIIPQSEMVSLSFKLANSQPFEVYGYSSNTALVQSCEAAGLKFYPLSPEQTLSAGDVDGNGAIDLLDVITLNKNLLGLQQLDESQQKAADVNADDSLDSSDSLLILRYTVHLEDKLG